MESMSVCQERIKKQNFLKKEILQKGYDAQEFQEFLEGKKYDGGNNIDLWEFEELEEFVKQFHSTKNKLFINEDLDIINLNYPSLNPQSSQKSQPELIKSIANITNEIDKSNENKNEEQHLISELSRNNYKMKKDCKLLTPTILNELDVSNFEVTNYEVKQGSLFTSNYIVYTINVKTFDWTVQRKVSDFHWLADTLKENFPCCVIPPLPKKTGISKQNYFYLERKKKIIENFLHDVIKDYRLKNSQCFLEFLSNPKKDFSEVPKSNNFNVNLENIRSPNGEILLEVTQELDDFHIKTAKFLNIQNKFYREIQQLNKQLILDFDQISSTLFELGEIFSQLYNESIDYCNSTNADKFRSLSDIYVNMNNFMISWGNHFSGFIKNIEENLINFFHCEKKYSTEMRLLESKRNQSAESFVSNLMKLEPINNNTENKNENFLSNFLKNSLKSFSGKTTVENLSNTLKSKEQFAFYNYNVYEEICKNFENHYCRFAKNFLSFGKSQAVSIMELHIVIADLLCNFEENQQIENKKPLTIMKSNVPSRRSSKVSINSLNNSFQGNKGEEFIFS